MGKKQIYTYEDAVNYLYQIPRFTEKHSLEETKSFLHKLGDPDRKLHIIHVAGTNGKGSVCAYMRSLLEQCGRSVSVFTSPHLVDIRERFLINGRMPGKEEFLETFLQIYEALDWEALENRAGYHPTYFEYLFFMAMLLFSDAESDYCILETGLGGRLDATNSVSSKILTVITRIGLDHTAQLGNTIPQIASEKAGIMMKGVPLVYADTDPKASEVFRKKAGELGIEACPVSRSVCKNLKIKNKTIDFSLQYQYDKYVEVSLPTIALYQAENAAVAVYAVMKLLGDEPGPSQIAAGLSSCFWAGRMEEVIPQVYVDGAHNPDGIAAFLESVGADGYDGRRRLLFGVSADKDFEQMFSLLVRSGYFKQIVFTGLKNSRGLSPDSIRHYVKEAGYSCIYCDNAGEALDQLYSERGSDRIYVTGSLYLVGEIKELTEYARF